MNIYTSAMGPLTAEQIKALLICSLAFTTGQSLPGIIKSADQTLWLSLNSLSASYKVCILSVLKGPL